MLTQCPNCQTTFRITSEILRVAHGQVRCGRCHTQFDALERLIEEDDTAARSGLFQAPPQPEQIEVEEPAEQEDITLEGRHIEISGTYRVMDDPDEPQVRHETTEEWVEIEDLDNEELTPEADGIVVEEDVDASEAERAAIAHSRSMTAPSRIEDEDREQNRFARRLAAAASADRRARETELSISELESLAPAPKRRSTLTWAALAVPLTLLLVVQIVHHYRSELARDPRFGEPIVNVYSALGLTLTPDWQLHAYEIKQWGVLSDPTRPGTLKVRASITNRADFPQPYPLLRLVLEDRWGDQVRARDFEPIEYLDPGVSAARMLPPGQPTNATIDIVDPGPDAEGFRFDICLRGNAPTPICAGEVPR